MAPTHEPSERLQPIARFPPPSLLLASSPSDDVPTFTLLRSPSDPTLVTVSPDSDSHDNDAKLQAGLWYALFSVFGPQEPGPDRSVTFSSSDPAVNEALKALGADSMGKMERGEWFKRFRPFATEAGQFGEEGKAAGPEEFSPAPKGKSQEAATKQTIPAGGSTPVTHPIRPSQRLYPTRPSPLYTRYIPHLSQYLLLSLFADSDSDIDLLHGWLNDPRVDKFWQDKGTREEHVSWLRGRYEDDRVLPVLGSFQKGPGEKEEPFGYFEIYWAAEDKIGRFYPAGPYDRGLHMLVGSSSHRGPHRVRAWLPSLCHYIFLSCPLTERVVSEPDARNDKMVGYLQGVGFAMREEVDMGHKRAKVMVLEREEFYRRCPF